MSNRLISIILPVYNLEDYLTSTLINLTQEQFSSSDSDLWELIIVNDGSTDNSAEIIAEYAKNNYPENINLLTTENRGVSHARNTALKYACGKYVLFVDGDDLINRQSILPLCHILEQNDVPILHFGYTEISAAEYPCLAGNTPAVGLNSPKRINTREFCNQTVGLTQPISQWAVWQNLFLRDFIKKNRISFNEELTIGEDAVFMWTALLHTTEILIIDTPIYNYTVRSDSAFHKSLTQDSIRNRLNYIMIMTAMCAELQDSGFGSQTIFGIQCNLRVTARHIVTEGLIRGEVSFCNIFHVLKFLKKQNISGIGLTRGTDGSAPFSLYRNIRRIITAYIITPIIKYFN